MVVYLVEENTLCQNIAENFQIFYLRPFATISVHFGAPQSQKEVKGSGIAYNPFSCVLGS